MRVTYESLDGNHTEMVEFNTITKNSTYFNDKGFELARDWGVDADEVMWTLVDWWTGVRCKCRLCQLKEI